MYRTHFVWIYVCCRLTRCLFPAPVAGSCSAPGDLYRNNVTLQDDRFNLAWWNSEGIIGEGMNATAANGVPGMLWGAAPNSWFARDKAAAAAAGLKPLTSIVLVVEDGENRDSPPSRGQPLSSRAPDLVI